MSLPFLRARLLVEEGRRGAKSLLFIKENIHITIAVTVMLNNAINIMGAFFVGQKITKLFGEVWLGWASAAMTIAIIVFSEIFPKAVGERYKIPISLTVAKPLKYLVYVLGPIAKLILKMGGMVSETYTTPKVDEGEIRMMLKIGRDAGTVEMDEEVLCNRVFKLNDVRANQVMRPIEKIFALPGNKMLWELRDEIVDSRYSRIAVYDKDPTDFVGVVEHRLLQRHIARGNDRTYVKEFMSPPIFVHHLTKADAILEKFLAYNQHLFIVQDDAGKAVGLVTMEDVLEELFGEIYDEKDIKAKAKSNPQSPQGKI